MDLGSTSTLEERIRALKGPIFVFGASGFIGTNLIKTLLKWRNDCYAITHEMRGAWRLKLLCPDPKSILFADILFKNSVRQIFREYQPRTVFDLSAYGAYSKQDDPNITHETNIIGALNILQECEAVAAYVHAGSSSEYGLNCDNPDEDAQLSPNSHYAVSKIAAAYLVKYYGLCKHLPFVNLRLFSVYGAW